jgi:hypothetical protein
MSKFFKLSNQYFLFNGSSKFIVLSNKFNFKSKMSKISGNKKSKVVKYGYSVLFLKCLIMKISKG